MNKTSEKNLSHKYLRGANHEINIIILTTGLDPSFSFKEKRKKKKEERRKEGRKEKKNLERKKEI